MMRMTATTRHNRFRVPTALIALALVFFLSGAGAIKSADGGPDLAGPDLAPVEATSEGAVVQRAFVARVGDVGIEFATVFHHWEPAWRDILRQCASGEKTAEEADEALQAHWEDAIDVAVREEIFHQEAQRFRDARIEGHARAAAKAAGANRAETSDAYRKARMHLEAAIRERERELVDLYIAQDVRQFGGQRILLETLARQGMTWEQYRDRKVRMVHIRRYQAATIPDSSIAQPRPSEIRGYYREHPEEFRDPEKTTFRHIFLSYRREGGEEAAKRKALEVLHALQEDAITFEAAVAEHSDDAVSVPCGGLEPLPEEAPEAEAAVAHERLLWLAAVRDEAQTADPGLLPKILMSNAGCHIVRIEGREEGALVPFAEAQERIAYQLKSAKRERLVRRQYVRLRKSAHVEILEPHYPPDLSWPSVRKNPSVLRGVVPEILKPETGAP